MSPLSTLVLSGDSVWVGASCHPDIIKHIATVADTLPLVKQFLPLQPSKRAHFSLAMFALFAVGSSVGLVSSSMAEMAHYKVDFSGLCYAPLYFGAISHTAQGLGGVLATYLRYWIFRQNRSLVFWLVVFSAGWLWLEIVPSVRVKVTYALHALATPFVLCVVDVIQLSLPSPKEAGAKGSRGFEWSVRAFALGILVMTLKRYGDVTVIVGQCQRPRRALASVVGAGLIQTVSGLAVVSMLRMLVPTKLKSPRQPSVPFKGDCHFVARPVPDQENLSPPSLLQVDPTSLDRIRRFSTGSVTPGVSNDEAFFQRHSTLASLKHHASAPSLFKLVRFKSSQNLLAPPSQPRINKRRSASLSDVPPSLLQRINLPPPLPAVAAWDSNPPLLPVPPLSRKPVLTPQEQFLAWGLFPDRLEILPDPLARLPLGRAYTKFVVPGVHFHNVLAGFLLTTSILAGVMALFATYLVVTALRFDPKRGCFVSTGWIWGPNPGAAVLVMWSTSAITFATGVLVCFAWKRLVTLLVRFIRWWMWRQKMVVFVALPLCVIARVASPRNREDVLELAAVVAQMLAFPLGFASFDAITLLLDMPSHATSTVCRAAIRFMCATLGSLSVVQVATFQARSLFTCEATPAGFAGQSLLRMETIARSFVALGLCSIYAKKMVNPASPAVFYSVKKNVQERWDGVEMDTE